MKSKFQAIGECKDSSVVPNDDDDDGGGDDN
jgi:hypothetical protein